MERFDSTSTAFLRLPARPSYQTRNPNAGNWSPRRTKTGNAHLRRAVGEAAWASRHRPAVGGTLRKRQEHVSQEIAWKAQQRLHQRYRKLLAKGKNKGVVVTAVGRELLGFLWAIGIKVETFVSDFVSALAQIQLLCGLGLWPKEYRGTDSRS